MPLIGSGKIGTSREYKGQVGAVTDAHKELLGMGYGSLDRQRDNG